MANLYQITENLEDLLQNEDATEEQLTEAFGALQTKGESICKVRANLKADIEAFKAEEKRLADRRKAMENGLDRLEERVKLSMEMLQIEELTCGTFKLRLQSGNPTVVVDDYESIPARFFTIVPEMKQLEKKALAAELKQGPVLGAHLESKKSLRIR